MRSASCEGETGVLGTFYLPEAFNELLSYSLFYEQPSSMLFVFDSKLESYCLRDTQMSVRSKMKDSISVNMNISVHRSSLLIAINALAYLYAVRLMVLCCH